MKTSLALGSLSVCGMMVLQGRAGENAPSVEVERRLTQLLDAPLLFVRRHELQAGDVDGDGDIDICSKAWGVRSWNGNAGRMHVDFLENLLKSPRLRQ